LTGIRSRVTGNAASAGANVRGAYLEAKVGAGGKYAAQLEGALIHADYSAGSATISGDVRGLTVQISQGTGLNAANLYGILLNIQTRGSETITSDDVGLLIRNQAVGGNGRMMDSAIKIAGLNMGGGTVPFLVDITFQNGATLYDDGTDLTLAGSNLTVPTLTATTITDGTATLTGGELDGATIDSAVAKGTWTASGTWQIPAVTLGGIVTINGQVFDAGSGSARINTTGSGEGLDIYSTNDSTNGVRLSTYHVTANPAIDDVLFEHYVYGKDTGGTQREAATFRFLVEAVGATTLASKMAILLRTGSAWNEALTLSSAGALWIAGSITLDANETVDGIDVSAHDIATTGVHGAGGNTIATTADITATKLDDFATPDNNTDLDSTTSVHGLLKRLDNTATNYMDGTGAWSVPAGGGGGDA